MSGSGAAGPSQTSNSWTERHPVLVGALAVVLASAISVLGTLWATADAESAAAAIHSEVVILRPEPMEVVKRLTRLKGIATDIPPGKHLWFASHSAGSNRYFYWKPPVQEGKVFNGMICIGADDIGGYFEVIPILVSDSQADSLTREKKANPDYFTTNMIDGVTRFPSVTVQRGEWISCG